VTLVLPVLVRVTVADCSVPAVTLPKASLVGLVVSCPVAGGLDEAPVLTPWHPARKISPERRSNPPTVFPKWVGQISRAAMVSIASRGRAVLTRRLIISIILGSAVH